MLLVLLLSSFLVGCDNPVAPQTGSFPSSEYKLPKAFSIRDVEGRTLEIQLIGRTDSAITFNRLSDNRQFTFPIHRLAPEHQALVMKFPETSVLPSDDEITSLYISSRRKAIAKLDKEIVELYNSMRDPSLTTGMIQAKEGEVLRKKSEISKMEAQIAEKQR